MSTNYYITKNKTHETYHLAMTTAKYKMLIQGSDEIQNLKDFMNFLDDGIITDENNRIISKNDFIKIFEEHQKLSYRDDTGEYHKIIDDCEFCFLPFV